MTRDRAIGLVGEDFRLTSFTDADGVRLLLFQGHDGVRWRTRVALNLNDGSIYVGGGSAVSTDFEALGWDPGTP